VRITTALNRLLRLRGASVIDVSISVEAIIVTVRLRRLAADLRDLRADRPASADPRAARQALAPPRSRLDKVRDRVRAAPPALPSMRDPS